MGDAKGPGILLTLAGWFELALRFWHVTPEYVLENWTDEEWFLMRAKYNDYAQQEAEAIRQLRDQSSSSNSPTPDVTAPPGGLLHYMKRMGAIKQQKPN